MPGGPRFRLLTPPPRGQGAAIAILQIEADSAAELDRLLQAWPLGPVPERVPASPLLRDLFGVDRGLVLRPSPDVLQLMPHGGIGVLAALEAALTSAGCPPATSRPAAPHHQRTYPEATDPIDALALDAIARAPSPLAVDVILRQRAHWRQVPSRPPAPMHSPAAAGALDRLLSPPTVVLLGPPNIGKSTLTNAMARSQVSVVADEPGTTRDHVGVSINLAGLAVHWIDAPGRADGPTGLPSPTPLADREAHALAEEVTRTADLVLFCVDAPAPSEAGVRPTPPGIEYIPHLTVALRADLAPRSAPIRADIVTAAALGEGLTDLARAIRRLLVPDELCRACARWRFHPDLPR